MEKRKANRRANKLGDFKAKPIEPHPCAGCVGGKSMDCCGHCRQTSEERAVAAYGIQPNTEFYDSE